MAMWERRALNSIDLSKMEEVKLFGKWPSPYLYRVIWALKLKGVPYEYIEEDLSNKSAQLLQYNPVHKKIPVLVHCGKPICESLIILEYIEDTWLQHPLLPNDPYDKAVARFWAKFADDKGSTIFKMITTTGEEHEKDVKDSLEVLRTVEEYALGEKKFFSGEMISIVDIAFGGIVVLLEVIEDVLGVKLLESHTFPRLHAWINNFKDAPLIKDNLPDSDEMLIYFKHLREKYLLASP